MGVLFDSEGKIKKYKSAIEIMEEFATMRLKYYDHRKKYLIDKLTLERDLLSNRARFIKMIIEKKLHINNRKKADVCKDLTRFKFQKFGDTKEPRTGFEYLLIMQIASLTKERKEELERMAREKAKELELVKKTSPQAMWLTDLKRLETAVTELYEKEAAEDPKAAKGNKRKRDAGAKGKKGKQDDDEDVEGGEDEEGGAVDPMDNPFADITKWTMGALKNFSGPATKKRKAK